MYPLGLLFGLGFDTATEVGLLGISATQASKGLPDLAILVFPALFTAGMTLVDTTDNLLMLGAYGWASSKPDPKAVLQPHDHRRVRPGRRRRRRPRGAQSDRRSTRLGRSRRLLEPDWALNDNFGVLGGFIVGIFVLSWVVSYGVYRAKGYDEIKAVGE